MMSRNEHRSLRVAELMGRFAEEALELHLGLSASWNFLVVVRICDGDNLLVRGFKAFLQVARLLLELLMINCID